MAQEISISKSENRKVAAWRDGEHIIVQERESLTSQGFSRKKWTDDRISLTLAEIQRLAKFAAE